MDTQQKISDLVIKGILLLSPDNGEWKGHSEWYVGSQGEFSGTVDSM